MVPKPYNIRWTAKLIRRDLKAIAAKCISKIQHMMSHTTTTATATSDLPSSTSMLDDVSEGLHGSSIIAHSIDDNDSTTRSESAGMVAAGVTDTGAVDAEAIDLTAVSSTFYAFLTASLKDLYASRDRDLPLPQRWVFRGAWLLLHLATQYCSSNPSYDICKGRHSKVAEVTVPHEGLHNEMLPSIKTGPPRVSQMPTMIYAQRKEDHRRHDSLFGSFCRQTPPPDSSKHLWYTICAGALEHTKTVLAAESLLSQIGVEKDASAMLEVIGNPGKRLSDEDGEELQRRLGQMLYPELFC
ncbi:hypothetical protein E8E13_003313 [Curvularia kusanoi]|uniref:Uncharacterized protein n=1 Tax=Curvularia kusanoi TaxID=90978 RepID=A0A9P4TE71_CURKU|nr:hypothetical protein E8E13_003313 [Curvularia kusanoi]